MHSNTRIPVLVPDDTPLTPTPYRRAVQWVETGKAEWVSNDLKTSCWKGYEAVGTKKKNGKTVPNCVPLSKTLLLLNGVGYESAIANDGSFVLLKASNLKHGDKRSDDKGRNWVFNGETRRWRVDRGESSSSSSSPKNLSDIKGSVGKQRKEDSGTAPKSAASATRKVNQVMKQMDKPMNLEEIAGATGISKAYLKDHLQTLTNKGKLHAHPNDRYHTSPPAGTELKPKKTRKKTESTAPKPDKAASNAAIEPTSTPTPEEPQTPLEGQAKIDQSYASENPTDEHIKNWMRDTALHVSNPEDSNVHARTLNDLQNLHNVHPDLYDKAPKYIENVRDKKSWAEAVHRREQESRGGREGGEYTWKDFSMAGEYEQKLQAAKQKLENPKTKNREKVQQDIGKLEAKIKSDRESSERAAQRMNQKTGVSKKQRLKELGDIYDKRFDETKAMHQRAHDRIKSGQQRAIDAAVRPKILQLLSERAMESREPGDPIGVVTPKEAAQISAEDIIREHLQNLHRKSGGDAKVLGLSTSNPSQEELKRAYKQAARSAHPDAGGSAEAFQRVNQAYQRMMKRYPDGLQKAVYGDRVYSVIESPFGWVLVH